MTPGFLGGAGGGEKPVGLSDKNANGASILGAAENAAADSGLEQGDDSIDGAAEGEESVGDVNYSGGGREEADGEQGGFFSEHKGAVGFLIALILILGGLVGGAQSTQLFSWAEQLRTTFNKMEDSVNLRSNSFFRYQLGKDVKNPLRSSLFGKKFKVSSKQEAKLKQRGIDLEEVSVDGKMKTVMKYTDGSGNSKLIVPDAKDVPKISSNYEVMDFETAFKTDTGFFEAYKGGSLTWRGAIANWFESLTTKFLMDNKLNRNTFLNFKESVDENGKLKGGAELMAKGTDEITTGGARVTGNDQSEMKNADGTVKTDFDDGTGDIKAGSGKAKVSTTDAAGVTIARSKGLGDVEANLTTAAKKVQPDSGGGISGMVQTGTSIVCGVGDVIGVISLVVSGAELLQMIRLATGFLEAIDKVKAGDGDTSPFNEFANALNTRDTSTHYDFNIDYSSVASLDGVDAGESSSWQTLQRNADNMTNNGLSKSSTNKTAMESSGITSLFGGGKVDPNDPSVKSLNFASSIKRFVGGLGVSMAAFNTCAIAKLGANLWGMAEDAMEYIPCIIGLIGAIFSYGATSVACGPAVMNIISKIALSAVISAAVSAVISAVVPFAARMLVRDLITDLAGEDLGNALVSGANVYMGNNYRYNGGSLANKNKYLRFAAAHQQVVAENAKYERLKRSPFDASSQYTFMGTLLRQMMGFVGSSSVMSVVTSTNSVVGSSIAAISPTASAIDVNDTLIENYDEVCPYLDSIGAVGDAFCNPYAVSDVSTMEKDPSEVMAEISNDLIYKDDDGKVVNCNTANSDCGLGNADVKIKGNSQLAKYILFCDQRSSSFGIADQNISNELANWADVRTESGTINAVANGAIGGVPMLGDMVDVVQNAQKLANLGYITGQSCVAGNDVPNEDSPMNMGNVSDAALANMNQGNSEGSKVTKAISVATPGWNKAKLYQRFIEDQSLMESMGIVKESAVTAFINEYREEHPLDNSYAGLLARYSGLEKNDVIAVLDAIDYYTYLANYDPDSRYAFGQDVKPEGAEQLRFDNDNKVAYVVLLNTIEFADVRNRSFVV
jgi:hypothetical protein